MTGRDLGVPELSLVVLVGVSGSGKSTFAARAFEPFEVLSSDFCRGLVSNDENRQAATKDAFEVLHYIAGKRLAAGRLTVVDATNVQRDARAQLVALARQHDVLPVAIVLDVPEKVCAARNAARPDRDYGAAVIRRQSSQLRKSLRGLKREGFRKVHVLTDPAEIETAVIVRERLQTDLTDRHGPFDVIGDVHGCRTELERLLADLGYVISRDAQGLPVDAAHLEGRTAVFLGDLVDRGPDSPGVLRLVMGMVTAGHALCVPGNHENKLVRALQGRDVQVSHGLAETLDQLAQEEPDFREKVRDFCDGLVSHLILDGGRLVVAHAGLKESYHGRASGRVRSFALYGDTTGETDEFGLPVRYPWAEEYRGRATVLYGHTPTPDPEWVNNTMCLDTGCVFGGRLTALRYPERELVSVPAEKVWYEPVKPLRPQEHTRDPRQLDIGDVQGKRVIETGNGRITIREDNAAGALEVMSRFAADPRWLMYQPPTMAPCETSTRDDYLEFPDTAFEAYRRAGVDTVICEEKHMGSRAVILVCRDEMVAPRRFGIDGQGIVHTRTGRPFFSQGLSDQLLQRISAAVTGAGLWDELDTDWVLLDAELLPWSVKAEELLKDLYACVGAAARTALPRAGELMAQAQARGLDLGTLPATVAERARNIEAFSAVYRRYCWPTDGLTGIAVAPFQVLASEGRTYEQTAHDRHLSIADRLVDTDSGLFRRTSRIAVDTADADSVGSGIQWWLDLTAAGGEGMVVKPLANLVNTRRGVAQPGIKVRGREYLRIIYGPDYLEPGNLSRLKERRLSTKRSLAIREYALGLESLRRLVEGEPLWRIHEAVFGVLALESEPVDPRL